MGLAGPRKRTKLSHDPNNTQWTSNSTSFGLKIMTSQGWTPGSYLGAIDAPHAELHTAANASFIRVTMKEDNLGLGAKIGSGVGVGECTGLDVFKDILGRLNGVEEGELKKEREEREEMRRRVALEGRWGAGVEGGVRFVKGGWLIGDKIEALIEGERERIRRLEGGQEASSSESGSEEQQGEAGSESAAETSAEEPSKATKKRKRDGAEDIARRDVRKKTKKTKSAQSLKEREDTTPEIVAIKIKKSKKKRKYEASTELQEEVLTALEDIKLSKKKSKKKKDKDGRGGGDDEKEGSSEAGKEKILKKDKKKRSKPSDTTAFGDASTETSQTKRDKKEKKHKKRINDTETSSLLLSSLSSELPTKSSTPLATPAYTTNSSGVSTPLPMQGRHAVRSRNITQKKLACLDTAALKQIFMIKS